MSTHKKNLNKLKLALIKLQEIKQDENNIRSINRVRDKR
jgi:hypothetical protein